MLKSLIKIFGKRNTIGLFEGILILVSLGNSAEASSPKTLVFDPDGTRIVFTDHLHHEFYWWPQTLLNFQIEFQEEIETEELILIDNKTNEHVPFQLSRFQKGANGKMTSSLFLKAGLESGGSFDFTFKKGPHTAFKNIEVSQEGDELVVKTDKLSLWVPASQEGNKGQIPGPIASLSRNSARLGQSTFNSSGKALKKITSKIVEQGPLFAELTIEYFFDDGSKYHAVIRCVKGYDFVELREQIEGFSREEACAWDINWTGFSPTHRQAPNHPYGQPRSDKTGFERFDWETVGQNMLNSHHGITYAGDDGKIPFELGIYGNWPAEHNVTSSVFWDENSSQSVGTFTQDVAFWDDQEYAIWHAASKMNVKFYYQNDSLIWKYPLYDGKRSSAISCYPHKLDIEFMEKLEKLSSPSKELPRAKMSQLSYNSFLQNRYSTIDLNKVKDWELSYPQTSKLSPAIFNEKNTELIENLGEHFLNWSYVCELPISGPCQNSGYAPVPAREFYEHYVQAFNAELPTANNIQYERLSAMFLLHAYLAESEEFMPVKTMLSGHPNFLADVKSVPAMAAFLFPEHPEAKNWGDVFEKYIDLNTRYHVRPEVKLWNSQGGRWTENISCYTWAFLRPTVRANFLLQEYGDGKNRLANERIGMLGEYVLGSISAPFDGEPIPNDNGEWNGRRRLGWGMFLEGEGPSRVHPPQGAHADRRRPPSLYWRLGQTLKNYDPLLSENMCYVARPEYDDMEVSGGRKNSFEIMYPTHDIDQGTPPDLKSVKLTGYGIMLRSAVGTEDELSILLQQIDKGPNYRWGIAADGGCGTIYYYAGGKSYSHNAGDDIGDRRLQDTDLITNFGVFKDERFKSIGKGDLSSPMYCFSSGQFAEIRSSDDGSYSWPDYQSRSIMLLGSDYFLVYDDVYNQNLATRFSWFTHIDEELPDLEIVKAGGAGYTAASRRRPEFTSHTAKETKGIWYDGTGDFLTFVSHKKGFERQPKAFGCIVTSPTGTHDYIFRSDNSLSVSESGLIFEGTAGFIRMKESGSQEWALFHGTKIGNEVFSIQTINTDAGIGASFQNAKEIIGEFYCPDYAVVDFQWKHVIPKNIKFYLDGNEFPVKREGNKWQVKFPKGNHIWTVSGGLPTLLRPQIDYTQNEKGTVIVSIDAVPGASSYRYEYSLNGTTGWEVIKTQKSREIQVYPLVNEGKGYIRVIASNKDHRSEPSVVYPIYYTIEKPHFPDGLKLILRNDKIDLSWGSVLGCNEYSLYKRQKGEKEFELVYHGNGNVFSEQSNAEESIYEYAVTASNGNGESNLSGSIDTDPSSWLNFDPMPGEPFRRSKSKWNMSDNYNNPVDLYYPGSEK